MRVVYRIKARTAVLFAPDFGYAGIDLVQVMSASGARYLSSDSIVEFWEHQGEGKLSIRGTQVFLGKIE